MSEIILSMDDEVIRRFYNASIKTLPAQDHRFFKENYYAWVNSMSEADKKGLVSNLRILKKESGKQLANQICEMLKFASFAKQQLINDNEVLRGQMGSTANDGFNNGNSNPTLSDMGSGWSKPSNSNAIGPGAPAL